MADWATFLGVAGILLCLLLALAHASAAVFEDAVPSETESADFADSTESADVANSTESTDSEATDTERWAAESDAAAKSGSAESPTVSLSTPALLANVVLSQGLFAVVLVAAAWYTQIPAGAVGLSSEGLALGTVGTGVAAGGLLYGLNEAAAAVARWQGLSTPSGLREALTPETAAGWALLFVVVLPIIAGFEELLFRGALIGVVHAGFGVPLWLLAVGSSAAFALGHGAQGRLGIVVTGLLGLGLATAFLLTGSLVVVIVAHYVVNAAEFVVHEGLELV